MTDTTIKLIIHDEYFQDDNGNEFCVFGHVTPDINEDTREVKIQFCRVWLMKETYNNKAVSITNDSFETSLLELIRRTLKIDYRYSLVFDCEIVRI